jgi:hypothetical protein
MYRAQIKSFFCKLKTFDDFIKIAKDYAGYLKPERVLFDTGSFKKERGYIIDFKIRCNERISFNDKIRNNDLLVIAEYVSEDNFNLWTFNCTVDPATDRPRIAHLSEQIYTGNIGIHRMTNWRKCIRSDKGAWFKRTVNGVVVYEGKEPIGLHQHNSNGLFNSSAGCPILDSEPAYNNVFKPLLARVTNRNSIACCVINEDYFLENNLIIV